MNQSLDKINKPHNGIGSRPKFELDINGPKVQQKFKTKQVARTKWGVYKVSFMLIRNQNLFFWLSVLSSLKMRRFLNQSWPLIDLDDTKTLLICLLIKLLSVLEMYLEPKAKALLKGLRIPYPVEGSKFPSSRT